VPAHAGLGLDDGQVARSVIQGSRNPNPKSAISGSEPWSPRRSLQDFELVAQGEVFEGELPPGTERGGECKKKDFERRGMLCSSRRNRNGCKVDGVFGTDKPPTRTKQHPEQNIHIKQP
jgi:hypothetical protein